MPSHETPQFLQRKVRRLTIGCFAAWLLTTLMPVALSFLPPLQLGPWPLDFWLAAQGCVLIYLALTVFYAWQVNRWERQAGALSFELPQRQDN